MPRGFTQENFDVLNERVRILSLPTDRFLNLNVIAIGGVVNYVASVRAFRPKALQLHYFKNACPQIPNSLFELFFDVSPASVSIINTSRDPYMGADSENLDISELPSSMAEVQIASNMAYCLGAMGISAENNNLPQLRQPRSSDFDESSFNTLKDVILNSFEQGASYEYGQGRVQDIVDVSEVVEVVEEDEPFDLGEPMAEEVVEEVVEETPVQTSDARDSDDIVIELYQAPILQENAGYETISAKQLPISLLQFKRVITGEPRPSPSLEENTYDLLAVAEYLVQVGYTSDSVGKFLKRLSARGFVPTNIGIERRRFGTYLNMTIVRDSPLSGNVASRRFTSNTYKNYILNLLESDGIRASFADNNFKPVKFTGGANRGGGRLVGAVAIPILRGRNPQSYPNFVSIRPNVIDRYATAYQRELGSESTTDSSETTTVQDIRFRLDRDVFGSSGYALIGYQRANSGSLYNRENRMLKTSKKIQNIEDENVFVFYFLSLSSGEVYNPKLKKLQWGKMVDYTSVYGNSLDLLNPRQFADFYSYLRTNNRLSTRRTLKLTDVQFPIKRFLKKIINGQSYIPTFSNRITDEIDLGEETFNVLTNSELNTIKNSLPDESLDDSNNLNDELASGSTAQNTQDNARISRSVEAIKTQKIDRTFAYEIEGNWVGSGGDRARENQLRKSIREILKEKYENQALVFQSEMDSELNVDIDTLVENEQIENYSINDSQNRAFSITLKLDGSVRGKGISEGDGFETDTRIFIPPNIDLAKTNLDESVSSTMFTRYKFKNDASMWMWNEVFCEAMLRSGVRVHKSAGLHIHVSTVDYTEEDRSRYLENYAGFEPLLDLIMPVNSRKAGRSYNASIIQRGSVTTGHQQGKTTPDPSPSQWRSRPRTGRSKVRTDLGGGGTGIGTFEFRHPMTSIEPNAVKHFIILSYSLVEVSKIKQFTSFKFKDLESFLPKSTATYIYNRIETLAQKDVGSSFFKGVRGVDPELSRRNLA